MQSTPDLSEVQGQQAAKRALEVGAAGGHPILLFGPPGAGKAKLARRLPGLLPPMSDEESAEVAEIYSRTGGMEVPPCRPFRSPHPSVSSTALDGGQRHQYPGEVSLAHAGVLFLDEFPELLRSSLRVVFQALREGRVHPDLPARFHLVASMSPCPCGGWGDPKRSCRCSDALRARYLKRVRRYLLEFEVTVDTPALTERDLRERPGERTETVAGRVAAARAIQFKRSGDLNTAIGSAELDRYCPLDTHAQLLLDRAAKGLHLDPITVTRIRKVARTIADLDQCTTLQAAHVGEAIQYRSFATL